MSIQALTVSDSGIPTIPHLETDWQEWISGSTLRNYFLQDPLLDWLALYGELHAYRPDTGRPGYDARTDLVPFLMEQGRRFEVAVVEHLKTLARVVPVGVGHDDSRSQGKAEETFTRMRQGAEIVYQGVIRNAQARTYGSPDLLVRSDVLARLFPGLLTPEEATLPAPDLNHSWHYRVVDIKFTTLRLLASGRPASCDSLPAYQAQVALYTHALGRLQGYLPNRAYLLGRGWTQRRGGVDDRGTSCMDRLAPIDPTDPALLDTLEAACSWLRRLRRDGHAWSELPPPSAPELRPNMRNREDHPWHTAKRKIAEQQEELTRLWQVGVEKRNRALAAGVRGTRDPTLTPADLGLHGGKQGPILQAILAVNRDSTGPPVRPQRVEAARPHWHARPDLEFYVDFETTTDLDDDFRQIPERGGQPLLFMIGCGHVEGGEWAYHCFTARFLTKAEEARILDDWLAHLAAVRERQAPHLASPLLIHWSHAEVSFLQTALGDSFFAPELPWFDFLTQVIRAEPVVVRGAWDFGLKSLARAFRQHGLIETGWGEGPADGLGTMAAAWWCAREAARRGCGMDQIDLMQAVRAYNEVDCRVMMEIVRYLRASH